MFESNESAPYTYDLHLSFDTLAIKQNPKTLRDRQRREEADPSRAESPKTDLLSANG